MKPSMKQKGTTDTIEPTGSEMRNFNKSCLSGRLEMQATNMPKVYTVEIL